VSSSERSSASQWFGREGPATGLHRTTPMGWRRAALATALAVVIVLGAAACGDDDDSTAATTAPAASGGTTPEERQVSDAEVTIGLKALPALVAAAVATTGSDAAKDALEPIEASWASYEGTVRTKEQDLYLTIEDNFANLQKALTEENKADAAKAQAAIEQAASDYLAKHP
jgi:hypothetical protein